MESRDPQIFGAPSAERIESLTSGLRRLARGLVRDPSDAEDLVQDVWVAALRSRPDDEGRLGAWFRRTLRNKAIDRRRDAARRARREQAAAVPEATPGDEQELFETLRVVISEVEALEEPYRIAVRLRFLEGEPPRRIAKQLGVPVTTVHSRIQRGLTRLRARLDARNGGDRKAWLATLAPWTRTNGALLGAGSGTGLVLSMKKQTVALLVLAGVLAGSGSLALWATPRDAPQTVVADGPNERREPLARVTQDPPVEPTGLERSVTDLPLDSRPATWARVRGRCIDDVSGAPLAGVTARFRGTHLAATGPESEVEAGAWHDLEPVTTDAEGVFEATLAVRSKSTLRLELSADGYAPKKAAWGTFEETPLAPGEVDDLGDIRMLRGFRVAGRVVDEYGMGVEGAFVGIDKLPLQIRGGLEDSSLVARSALDGHFAISALAPAGIWSLRCFRGEYLIAPRTVNVPVVEPLIVTVGTRRLVSGRVLDRTGEPLARVQVEGTSDSGQTVGTALTDAEGRFELDQRQPGDDPPTLLSVQDLHGGRRVAGTRFDVVTTWGQRDVELRVERTGQIDLHVVDAESGAPIERFAIKLYPRRGDYGTIRDAHAAGIHTGGVLRTAGLQPGENVLMVLPEDARWQVSEPLLIPYQGAPVEPIEVRLLRSKAVPVLVTDVAGEPIEGVAVELIEPGDERNEPFTISSPAFPRASILQGVSLFDPMHREPFVLDRQTTDSDGNCLLLHDPRVDWEVALRLRKTGFEPKMRRVTIASSQLLELQMSRAADVTGGLRGGGGGYAQARLQVWLTDPDGGQFSTAPPRDIDADGTFSISEVPAGRHDLRLGLKRRFSWVQGGYRGFLRWRSPLASQFVVSQGSHVHLGEFSVDTRPASVTGSVRVGGEVPAAARIWFESTDDSPWEGAMGTYPVDAAGRFDIPELPPGRWRPILGVGFDSRDCASWCRARDVIEVRPGERTAISVEVPRRVVVIRVVDPSGRKLVGARVSVAARDWSHGLQSFTREVGPDGRITLDPAPDVPFRLRVVGQRLIDSEPGTVEPSATSDGEPLEILLRVRTP